MYLPTKGIGCMGLGATQSGLGGGTQSGLGATQSGLGSIALPDQQGYVRLGMGDLSFDGTGIGGSGLFGYQPWYDTTQWTILEWAAIAAAAYYGLKAFGSVKSSRSGSASTPRRRRSLQFKMASV